MRAYRVALIHVGIMTTKDRIMKDFTKDEGKVGWGVIGACGIARRRTIPEGIVPAENASLEAVMDVDIEGARSVAAEFGGRVSETVEALVDDPAVRAVYVATPNHLHREHVVAAARAGKHVLCEKPLGLNRREIEEMIAACRGAGVLLGVGFMMRFNVYHRKIRDLIRAGALGTPTHARGQMTGWHPPGRGHWRHEPGKGGGGCVQDVASHIIDVMEMFFGRTQRVFCQCFRRVHDSPVEDTALLQVVFESGVPAMIDVGFAVPSKASEYVLEVYGSKGGIKCKYTLSQLPGGEARAFFLEEPADFASQEKARYRSGYSPVVLEPRSTYRAEVEAFSRAILEGRPAPVPGEAGLWNHLVIEAAYESDRVGRPVAPGSGPLRAGPDP